MGFQSYRVDDLQRNLQYGNYRPLDVMLAGGSGVGKSSMVNSIFGKSMAKVGRGVDPETMDVDSFRLNDWFRIWDTPGLGDGVADAGHKRKMTELLLKTYCIDGFHYGFIDLMLILLDGSVRDLGTTYRLLNDVALPNIEPSRILLMINQADLGMKGFHWRRKDCRPDEVLKSFLDEKAVSVQNRIREATGVNVIKPVCFSAEYGYNLKAAYDCIIDNIPKTRRCAAAGFTA